MDFKKIVPHLIGIGILLVLSAIFFAPNAFSGKVLPQPDNDKARGIQTEIQDYLKKEGKAPQWTNSTFGGMPSVQIYLPEKSNLTKPIAKALFLFGDYTSIWSQVFLAMACLYFLLVVLGADWRIAVLGGIAYGITTYNMDILQAGHSTKMAALALAPGILAGNALAFNRRYWLGGGVAALFLAMQIYVNHVQITYYTLIICAIYWLATFIETFRHKDFVHWTKAFLVVAFGIILGFGANMSRLWSTYEFSQETIRGGSSLSSKASMGNGLNPDYAFGWSSGVSECLTLIVPHAYGGGGNESIEKGKLYDLFAKNLPPAQRMQAGRQTAGLMYWGAQPFVGTAIYFGAVVLFLFFLGAFLVRGAVKWWFLGGGLFMIMLAMGKNFPQLNYFLFDYMPMFKKFRAVTMAFGPAEMCVAILAALGLQKFFDGDIAADTKKKAIYFAGGITGVLCLMVMMMSPGEGPNDAQLAKQVPDIASILADDRSSLATSDALRSLLFIALTAGLLWVALMGRLKAATTVIIVTLLALADNWMVCSRTISSDDYETKRTATAPPQETDYDKKIKQDKDIDYRVLDLARGSITGNGTTSYFHKSLSGYHAAKLQLFQEVVDTFLTEKLGSNLHIVGMLNGKYIVTPDGKVILNDKACGNAWFVKHYEVLPTPDAELHAIGNLNPKDSAVVQEKFAGALQGFTIQPDSAASIKLTAYHPDKMEYTYSAATEQFAVFSEIYYPPAKGWKCYLNGQPAPDFFKVDYLLRGMRLPAGQNMKLEMRFEPKYDSIGAIIGLLCSGLAILFFGAGWFFWFRKKELPDANHLDDMAVVETKTPAAPKAVVKGKKK